MFFGVIVNVQFVRYNSSMTFGTKGRTRMYFLAILLPPLAILLSGKPFQAFLNIFLLMLGWLPGVIHAVLVVKEVKDDKRMKKQAKLIAKEGSRY